MKAPRLVLPSLVALYICSISTAYSKSLEDIFTEMLALRTTEPAGFWAMVCCIGLLFSLAFGLMALTMGYYVRNWTKRK